MKYFLGFVSFFIQAISFAQPPDYAYHFRKAEEEIALGQWNFQPGMKLRYLVCYLDSVSVREMNVPSYHFLSRGDTIRFYWFDEAKQQYFLRYRGGYDGYFLASKNKQEPIYHEIQKGTGFDLKDISCGMKDDPGTDEAPIPADELVEGVYKNLTDMSIDNRSACRYYTINFFLNAMILRQGMDTLGCVQACLSSLFIANKVYQKEMNFGLSLNELAFLPINHEIEYQKYMEQGSSLVILHDYLDDIKPYFKPAAINFWLKDTAYNQDYPEAQIRGLGALNQFCTKNNYNTGMSYFGLRFEYILLHETGHIFGCPHIGTGCGSGLATIMCDGGGYNGFGVEAVKIIRGNTDYRSTGNCVQEAIDFTAYPCNQATPLKLKLGNLHYWQVNTDVYYGGKKQYSFFGNNDSITLNKPGYYTLRTNTTLLSPDKNCIAASEVFIPTGKYIVTDTNSWADGSLEQVIANCNQCPGLDTITFAFKEGAAMHLKGETPPVTDSLFIDGFKGRKYTLGDSLKPHKLSIRIEGDGNDSVNTGFAVYGPWFKMQGVAMNNTTVGVVDWLYDESLSKFDKNAFRLVTNRRGALLLQSNVFSNCDRAIRWDDYAHDTSTTIIGGADFGKSNYIYHTTNTNNWLYSRIGPWQGSVLFEKNFIGKVPGEIQMRYFTKYPAEFCGFTGSKNIVRSNVFFHNSGQVEYAAKNGEFSYNHINRDPYTGEIMSAGELLFGFYNNFKFYEPGSSSSVKHNVIYSINSNYPKIFDKIFQPGILIDSNQIITRYSTTKLNDSMDRVVKLTEATQDCAKNSLKVKVEGKHGLIKNHLVKVVLFASEKYKNDTSLGFEKVIWDTTFLCGANTFSLMASTASVPVNSRISVITSDITSQFTFGITSRELGTKEIAKQPALFSDTQVCPGNLIKLKRNNYFKNYLVNGVELKDSIWLGKGYHEILVKDSQGCQLKYTRNIGIIKNSILPELKSDSDYLAGDWVKVYRKNTGKILWKNPKYAGADFIDIFKDTIFLVATAKTVTVTQEYTDTATGCTGILTRKLVERKPATNGVENFRKEHLLIYPNPATSELHIYSINTDGAPMLYDAGGRQITVNYIQSGNGHFVMNVDNLASGIYTLRCGSVAEKLVVVHE